VVLQDGDGGGDRKAPWGSNKLGNGCESSPKPGRKQLTSSSEELQARPTVRGSNSIPSAVVGQNVKIITKPSLLSNTRMITNIKKNVVSVLNQRLC
jgi:hypothetical protein